MTAPTGPIPFPRQPGQPTLVVRPLSAAQANRANPYAAGNAAGATPAARTSGVVDTVELSSVRAPEATQPSRSVQGADSLVAAKVNRPVDFDPAPQAPSAQAYGPQNPAGVRADVVSLYQRSADLNAAATGVSLGRRLDVTG